MELPEDNFDYVFGHMRTSDIIFSDCLPDLGTLGRTADIIIGFSSDFVEDGGMNRVEGVERLGVELDGRHGVTAVGPDLRHADRSYIKSKYCFNGNKINIPHYQQCLHYNFYQSTYLCSKISASERNVFSLRRGIFTGYMINCIGIKGNPEHP